MSTLINLLPDLRQAKLRERQRRQLAVGLSLFIWSVCAGAIVLMFLSKLGQSALIAGATGRIKDKQAQLSNTEGIMDALTAQEHLKSLPDLYAKRVYITKFLNAYSEADPRDVTLGSMDVDETGLLTVNGTTASYAAVAKLARALEASNVTVGTHANADNKSYFSDVNVTTLTGSQGTGGAAQITFTLKAKLEAGVTSGN